MGWTDVGWNWVLLTGSFILDVVVLETSLDVISQSNVCIKGSHNSSCKYIQRMFIECLSINYHHESIVRSQEKIILDSGQWCEVVIKLGASIAVDLK